MATLFCGREPSLAPPTCGPNWTRSTLLWALLVVVTGATFFFMLVGWTTIQSVALKHKVYNVSIQLLTVEFTYLCAVLLPERCVLFAGLVRYRGAGVDAFGAPTEAIFHHLPYGQKMILVLFGICNSLAQLVNQYTRIVYFSWSAANTWPGVLWTNLFFALSFLAGTAMGIAQGSWEGRVRAKDPARFRAAPVPANLAQVRDLVLLGKWPAAAARDSTGIRESQDIV